MRTETFPYDAAELISDRESVFLFLEGELEEDEPCYWPGAIAIVARARGGFESLAEESGISAAFLRAGADELKTPNREMLVKVMECYRPRAASPSKVA